MTLPRHPAELDWLVSRLGAEATLLLIEARGGIRVFVPIEPTEGCELAKIVGLEPARKLAAAFGGEQLRVPLARGKWTGAWRARVYRARGMSLPEIARRLGCIENTVRTMLKAHAADTQMAMPLELPARRRA